jgi:recombination protein RecA
MVVKKPIATEDRLKSVLADIDATFGKGSIIRMGDDTIVPTEAISSGIPSLDDALGIGGFPRGRIVEVYGPESSGKSTLAIHLVAEAQKAGLLCAYLDMEYAIDPEYMRALDVNVDDLYLSQPDTAEQVLEIANRLARSERFGVIVIDSVNSMVPRAALEGEIGDANIGRLAKVMSDGLAKLVSSTARSGTILFFINQLREKIGVQYGSPETTSGGRALKFYASIRLDIRKRDAIKDGDTIIGNKTEVKVVKNKMAAAYKVAKFDIILGKGAAKENSLYDAAVKTGVLAKMDNGSWTYFEGEKFANGQTKGKERLSNEPETYAMVKEAVDKAMFGETNENI